MSMKTSVTSAQKYFNVAMLLCTLVLPTAGMAFDTNEVPCRDAETIQHNESLRGYGITDGESRFYQLEVPAAGLVTLDIAVPGTAEVEPKIGLFDHGCGMSDGPRGAVTFIERTPTGLVAWTETPGTFVFAVAAQDPHESLGEYKLTVGFVGVANSPIGGSQPDPRSVDNLEGGGDSPNEIEIEPNATEPLPLTGDALNGGGDSPGEIEIEPNASEPLPLTDDPLNGGGDSPGEIEIEPNASEPLPLTDDPLNGGGDSPGEIEIEPNASEPLSPRGLVRQASRELCRQLIEDDHGDVRICASSLQPGHEAKGFIHNSWADDHDLFAFLITEAQTIFLETAGPTDTFGTLLDRYGLSLATDEDSGHQENFRIVKTLRPGLYFVRIEGSFGAEGSYSLRLENRDW